MHLPNNRAMEFILKQKFIELEREKDNDTIIVGDIVKSTKIHLTIPSKDSHHMEDIKDHNNASTQK